MMMRIEQNELRERLGMMGDNVEDGVGGIVVLEKRKSETDRVFGYNCAGYCFGIDTWKLPIAFFEDYWLTTAGHHEVGDPEKDDLVVYIAADGRSREQTHIGRYEGNGLVRSKWCYGPIVLHPIASVPNSYGDEVRFFRRD